MKIHAVKLGLASALSVVCWNIVSWIISYALLSVQLKQLIALSFDFNTILSVLLNLGVSFIYGFLLVWLAALIYNALLES